MNLLICFLIFFASNAIAVETIKFAALVKLEASWRRCHKEQMSGKSSEYLGCTNAMKNLRHAIYEQPNEKSKALGFIVITDMGKKSFQWEKTEGVKVDFNIDGIPASASDGDWENSHTYIGCLGNWHKLPRNPFPTPVWIKLNEPCMETRGVYEAKLKWDLHATEVGTNKKVILPKGKIVNTEYTEEGKVILGEKFSFKDIKDDHPDVIQGLKDDDTGESMNIRIARIKSSILDEYENKGNYKKEYALDMKDFLDKDSHLPLTQVTAKDQYIETMYLDNK